MPTTLSRRAFLETCGAGALGALAGCSQQRNRSPLGASAATSAPVTSAPAPAAPAGSLASLPAPGTGTPRSLLHGSAAPLDLQLNVLSGALPADLGGHYFVVGSQPRGAGVFTFNGEGVVRRLDLASGRLRSRLVTTPCYYADQALAGQSAAFSNIQDGPARMSTALGVRNHPNTALIPLGDDRLLVTSDAGRPFELDPVTLETVTAVGWRSEWRPGFDLPSIAGTALNDDVFPLLQTSAHMAHDRFTGETFGANYGGPQNVRVFGLPLLGPDFTDLIRWDGHGALERWTLVDPQGTPIRILQSVHQMGVTEHYVVLADAAFRLELQKMLDPSYLEAQEPYGRLYLVRRSDLAATSSGGQVVARSLDLPREVAHFLLDYDDAGERITLHAIHTTGVDGSEWLLPSDKRFDNGAPVSRDHLGFISAPTDLGHLGRHVIDAKRPSLVSSQLVGDDRLTWGHTLYSGGYGVAARHEHVFQTWTGFDPALLPERVAQAYSGYPHRVRPLAQLPQQRPGTLLRYDARSAQLGDAFVFPSGWVPCSPELAPTGRGYVVCAVISDDASDPRSSGDELWVFAQDDLAQGPLCRLGHPDLRLAFTLHTAWTADVRPRTAGYRVDPVQDHARDVDALDPALRDVFLRQVFPRL